MLNQETIIKLAVQHGFKVGRDAGGEYVAPKYEDAVGSLVALVQAAYALGQEAQQAEPSQWRNEVKQLVSKYWEIAFQEGKSGENLADQANDILCQLDALLAQLTAAAATVEWPTAQDVGRIGDMSQVDSLRVGLDADNDVYVSIANEEGMADVEFCVPGSGGGKSPRTRAALISLMVAMEADNAETPSRDWWTASEAAKKKGGE